ncbi:RNA polymerase sigma factor [Chitinophaga niabensis]|uniref:RNA polymerase sigma-70 factor, ECF subfamily n=1 Tax=Chitinophaga niabensis TaxID=536979 RepID=A0A1N6F7X0_9BACT|nr:RNA polymerase sigma-70 factor [Chitinophaga niabensis]SIN91382.1 RNA polymerase sigma-70 factor, ECF subfamily [Chitinophaga niabensis]
MNEQALVQQLRSGDPSAFRLLYERYAPRLAAFATRFKAGREEADEIVQETFIRIWKHRDRIDAGSPFEAYVITIARNLIYNQIRKAGHQQTYIREITNQFNQQDPAVNARELQQLIGKTMQELPDKCRAIFRKSRLEGYSNAQIAEEMAISKSTVENQLNKALKIMRKSLESHGYSTSLMAILFIFNKFL